jgi:hypothetical protein
MVSAQLEAGPYHALLLSRICSSKRSLYTFIQLGHVHAIVPDMKVNESCVDRTMNHLCGWSARDGVQQPDGQKLTHFDHL